MIYTETITRCSVVGCRQYVHTQGMCNAHSARVRRHGDPLRGGDVKAKERAKCSIQGCHRIEYSKGFCNPHYQRFKRHGTPLGGTKIRAKKGSGHLSKDGYRYLFSLTHPNRNKHGKILEHVMVMAECLGRPLRKGETVHHKNGIKHDNTPSNLEVWSTFQPCGQRVTDKIEHSANFLLRYLDDQSLWPSDLKWLRRQLLDSLKQCKRLGRQSSML